MRVKQSQPLHPLVNQTPKGCGTQDSPIASRVPYLPVEAGVSDHVWSIEEIVVLFDTAKIQNAA